MRMMLKATYRALQTVAICLCAASTLAFAEALPTKAPSMSSVLIGVGLLDWALTILLSMSFGLVALLYRFKRIEPGEHYLVFLAGQMGGSVVAGVAMYLSVQSTMDSPNRFTQALAIGVAGWCGAGLLDWIAAQMFGRSNSAGKT